ncbi:MAG TPA: glycosyltransferase [Bryobacteraceae bacterium]|jgi:glycosyltransferase involved in cell wall biosynthesis|nr:glycosyltransferase [Bryobacteraceae bacterium]
MNSPEGETGPRVCLVVPCYNEAQRLDTSGFNQFLQTHEDVRIVFVDDGSRDATRQILQQLCRENSRNTFFLALDSNRGKAEAVRAGVQYALRNLQPEFVGYWDADLATPLNAVDDFVRVLRTTQVLMVFGARIKLLGRYVERRAVRHYLGRVFATTVSVMLRLPIYDSQCGAKLFRVNAAAHSVFADPFLSEWVFDVEILARYLNILDRDPGKLAESIYEYPLERWVDVAGSKIHPGDFMRAFVDVVRIRRKYL